MTTLSTILAWLVVLTPLMQALIIVGLLYCIHNLTKAVNALNQRVSFLEGYGKRSDG